MSEQEAGQNETAQKLSPGVVLARARNSQGLSLTEVADHLKITESYVRAIEESAFDDLPQAAFVRGYIRNYAKMVGLSGQQLVDDYDQFTGNSGLEAPRLQGGRKVKPLRAHSFPSPVHAFALVLVVSLAGLSYYLWNHWLSAQPPTQFTMTEELSVPADADSSEAEVILAAPADADSSHAEVILAAPADAESSDTSVILAVPADGESSDPSVLLAVPAEQGEPQPDEAAVVTFDESMELAKTLLIDFSQRCWVEIRDANNVVLLSGTQKAGSSIDMKVQPPARVRFGNTHGVEKIVFNGELISQPDTRGQVASIELTNSARG